jgi:hypothetical protein
MPVYNIAGITSTHADDETTVVHVGNIRKGDKETRTNTRTGKEYDIPVNLNYFRVTMREDLVELKQAFEKQVPSRPRSLRVNLAYPSLEKSWWAWNSIYKSGGMLGLHDGIWWNYYRDPDTNEVLVSDYMVTAAGYEKAKDAWINGFEIIPAQDAFDDYYTNYHLTTLPLPQSWRKVEIAIRRGIQPHSLLVNPEIPIYRTGQGDKQKDYFAHPEGRLMLTMPRLEGFTSFHLFQFKTGSINDVRELSKNLAQIAEQHKVFDSDMGSIDLDAIPMVLVRRQETISKMIDDKLTRGEEWLVHIETEPRWQRFVDDMKTRRTIGLIMAASQQEMSGLSHTAEHLELPEMVDPDELADEIETVEYEVIDEPEAEPEPETKQEEDREKIQKAIKSRATENKPEKKPASRKPSKTLPDLDTKPPEGEALAQAKTIIEAGNEINHNVFWAAVFNLGMEREEVQKLIVEDSWLVSLEKAVDAYVKKTSGKK